MLNNDQQRIHDEALLNLKTGAKQVYEYGGAAGTGNRRHSLWPENRASCVTVRRPAGSRPAARRS